MDQKKETKPTYTFKEAIAKARHYCAYQERCHKEVRNKLWELQVNPKYIDAVITDLIEYNFLNEERFAKTFADGKFRIKQWGRTKILRELKSRGISAYCIKEAMKEISDVAYDKTLALLAEKKMETVTGKQFEKTGKTAKYLINKGYESELVWDVLRGEE